MDRMCPNLNAKTGKQFNSSVVAMWSVSVCTTTKACVFGTKQSLCILSCVHKQKHQEREKTFTKLPQVVCAHIHVTSHDQRLKVQSALHMSSTIYINNFYICGGELWSKKGKLLS
jgi:hypothetical protein